MRGEVNRCEGARICFPKTLSIGLVAGVYRAAGFRKSGGDLTHLGLEMRKRRELGNGGQGIAENQQPRLVRGGALPQLQHSEGRRQSKAGIFDPIVWRW